MFNLGQKSSESHKLPSECIPGIEEIACDWTIWQFDNAVMYFFRVIRNALLERVNLGTTADPKWGEAKYALDELLDPDFRLPRPPTRKQRRAQSGLKAVAAANPGIFTLWKEMPKASG